MTQLAYIGLGSNLGESRQILANAIKEIAQLGNVAVSRLYRSPPMGPQDQPDYLNAVIAVETGLAPLALLDYLQALELSSGRVRLRHWGERTLDLDILLYGDESIAHPRLTVPHSGMLERDFVMLPLLDLIPNFTLAEGSVTDLACLKQPTAQVIADSSWYQTL